MDDTVISPADGGFTLIEVLTALLLLVVITTGVAALFVASMRSTLDTRDETTEIMLAEQKIEELRGARWDTPDMSVSPDTSLETNVPGFSDLIDAFGHAAAVNPTGTIYIRRWNVRPPLSGPAGLVLSVLVTTPRRATGVVLHARPRDRREGEVLLTTVKTAR